MDLEKTFDKVPQPTIRWALHRYEGLYSETRSRVRVAGVSFDSFEIGVCVHQGSVLSTLLYILVMA